MFHRLPAVPLTSWNPTPKDWLSFSVFRSRFMELRSSQQVLRLKFRLQQLHKDVPTLSRNIACASQKPKRDSSFKKQEPSFPQNVDLPRILPKKKKKPFPFPFRLIQKTVRRDKKLAEMGIEKPLEPPKNGLLVHDMVPLAYEVLDAWKVLIKGVTELLHVIPVYSCRLTRGSIEKLKHLQGYFESSRGSSKCSHVHVAHTGHDIQDCLGRASAKRRGFHAWVKGSVNGVLVHIESYHLYDPFGHRIKHETRFDYDRIPAAVELCIQAGVEIPEYPSRRRTHPVRMIGKKVIDRGGFVEEPAPWRVGNPTTSIDFDTYRASERFKAPSPHDVPRIAQETIDAYETVRRGVRKLMGKYTVKACGYCPEVHVGPWGHNVKLCGEFKHQWRDGKHSWQDAVPEEVIPPNYVWHVRDPKGPPLKSALQTFYGKAPAIVELCMQAGAKVPEKYKPMMRLDIIIPETDEANSVA